MTKTGLQRDRELSAAAHVAPLGVFVAFLLVPGWFRVENSELPWYTRAPELWVYPLQILACAAVLFRFRGQYVFAPWRGLPLACVLAVAGIAVWVAPAWLREVWVERGAAEAGWWRWLGLTARREGFDPTMLADAPGWQAAAVGMRFVRMVVIVPLVEELMWRGFLMRYVAAGEGDWRRVPFGTHSWRTFWVVTLMVMLIHQPADWAAAFVWGSLVYFLAVRTKSLGACVVMHAAGNLLLGAWVLHTRQWGFW